MLVKVMYKSSLRQQEQRKEIVFYIGNHNGSHSLLGLSFSESIKGSSSSESHLFMLPSLWEYNRLFSKLILRSLSLD